MSADRTLASRLVAAFESAKAIGPGPDLPDLTIAEGYAVQQLVDADFRAAGRKPVGWKIGHTSPEPMVGIIYADSLLEDGATLDLTETCAPKIEGEVLLCLGSIPSSDADDETLLRSLASTELAIEVADSRIAGWPAQLGHGIADNACCGRIVRGAPARPAEDFDWAGCAMRLIANGATIAEGTGGNCMGGALNVYRWFLKDSAERKRPLRPGDIVLTGSIALPTPMAAETSYEVTVEGLGKLALKTGKARP